MVFELRTYLAIAAGFGEGQLRRGGIAKCGVTSNGSSAGRKHFRQLGNPPRFPATHVDFGKILVAGSPF